MAEIDFSSIANSNHHTKLWILKWLADIAEALGAGGGAEAFAPASDWKTIPASSTDFALVPAVAGKKAVLTAVFVLEGNANTDLTFNSKGVGAGTAKSPTFSNLANGGEVLPPNPAGWIRSNTGEGITATTGAGSATAILYSYKYE